MKVLLALCLLAVVIGSLAEGINNETYTDNGDEVANRIWRSFSVVTSNGTIMFRGVRIQRTGLTFQRDVTVFGATINRQTSFGFGYYDSEANISDSDPIRSGGSFEYSAARVGGAVRLIALVEYLDTNGIDGFQINDTILSNYSLTPSTTNGQDLYNPVTRNNLTRVDNATGMSYTIHWLDVSTPDGVFHARIYVCDKPIFVDGRTLTPDRIKLTFEVNYWNPNNTVASTNPNAKLALIAAYAAAGSQTYRNRTVTASNDEGITSDDNDTVASGGYNWEVNTLVRNTTNTSDSSATSRNGTINTQFIRDLTLSGPFGTYGAIVSGAFEATWQVGLMVHDLNVTYGETLSWDPNADVTINYDTSSDVPTTPSSAMAAQVGLTLTFLFAIVTLLC